ncbi:MAG: division/cell wall cluster transcriptional repressor MraZ [Syntrophobacteraceae bacterium]
MGILNKPNFRGRSIHRLDAKGRLRIPTKFREVLQNHYTDALIIAQFGEEYLAAYPPEKWDEIESKAMRLSEVQPEHRSFLRRFVSSAEECEFDNQGRILIPPMLRDEVGLDQEVVLAGVLSNFEIWDKATWDVQAERDKQNHHKIMETIAGAGL